MVLDMLDFHRWNTVKDTAPGLLISAGNKCDFKPCDSVCAFPSDSISENVLGADGSLSLKEKCINLFVVTGVHELGSISGPRAMVQRSGPTSLLSFDGPRTRD